MGRLTLYGPGFSVYVRIVRLVFHETGLKKNTDYRFNEFDVFNEKDYPPGFRELNPFAKAPVLQHGGLVLYETGAITRYIDQVFGSTSLQPRCASAAAAMNQVISIIDNYAYPSMIWGVFVQRVSAVEEGGSSDVGVIDAAMPTVNKCLIEFERLLGDDPWFGGEQISLADCYLVPVMLYFLLTPEGKNLGASFPRLQQWWNIASKRPSVSATASTWG